MLSETLRAIILLGVNLLVLVVLQELNYWLSPLSIYLYFPILFVFYPALYLRLPCGLLCILLTSLFFDASLMIPYGNTWSILCVAYITIVLLDVILLRGRKSNIIILALILNALAIMANTFLLYPPGQFSGAYFFRALEDLLASELFLGLAILPYLKLQSSILKQCNLPLTWKLVDNPS
tara:strand:- start:57240 stop:57776 length:537 start_codon:yes stop_codon:yes gene_type:complete